MASQDWMDKDFYAILGVSKGAEPAAIKKAYRKLARQYHPDKNPGDPSAEQRFKDVGEAYAVLSDAEQRQQYDAIRAMAGGGARFSAGSGGPGTGGFEDIFSGMFGGGSSRFQTSGGGASSLDDLLNMFGGGQRGGFDTQRFGGGGFGFSRQPEKGADLNAATTISFRDAVAGAQVSLQVNGRAINVRIPAGVKDGQKIRLRGKGQPSPHGGPNGDMVVRVSVTPHPVFSADGKDLRVDLPLTFAEAALGATVPVPTLDGGTVRVKVRPGTPSGRVLRVKGRGIATKNGTGDLLATTQVVVPQTLSEEEKAAIESLSFTDPRADLIRQAGQ